MTKLKSPLINDGQTLTGAKYYTVYLYERDELGKFWPCGKYTFDSLKRAEKTLDYYATEAGNVQGMIRTPDYIVSFKYMTREEALRVSPVKLLAIR